LQRNECKRKVLEAITDLKEPAQPGIIATWLDLNYNVSLTDKACSMECLRLMRQGLLCRHQGRYTISEKGSSRLQFLRTSQ
jgi:hypothetical protein